MQIISQTSCIDTGIESNAKKNGRLAVIHCIEIIGLKNPAQITETQENVYVHINARGRKRQFTVFFSPSTYFKQAGNKVNQNKKLHKVMGYYIIEESL